MNQSLAARNGADPVSGITDLSYQPQGRGPSSLGVQRQDTRPRFVVPLSQTRHQACCTVPQTRVFRVRGGPSASTAAPDNAQERTLTRKGGVVTRERHDRFAPSQPALATCQLLLSAIAISLAMAVATLGVQAAAGQIQQVVGQLIEPGDVDNE